jgi:hypothetical protein
MDRADKRSSFLPSAAFVSSAIELSFSPSPPKMDIALESGRDGNALRTELCCDRAFVEGAAICKEVATAAKSCLCTITSAYRRIGDVK